MRPLVAALLLLTTTACATVQHGPVQRIIVDSDPQDALVRTSECGPGATKEVRTPAEVWVSRRAERCTLTFLSRGHYTERVTLTRRVSDDYFGNVAVAAEMCCDGDWLGWLVLGGLFAGTGFAVDTATGAMFEQDPHEVFVKFEPVSEEQPEAEPGN
jgi:hypothetical protein